MINPSFLPKQAIPGRTPTVLLRTFGINCCLWNVSLSKRRSMVKVPHPRPIDWSEWHCLAGGEYLDAGKRDRHNEVCYIVSSETLIWLSNCIQKWRCALICPLTICGEAM